MGNGENIILVPLRTSQTPDIRLPASHQGLEGRNQPRWDPSRALKQDCTAALGMPSPGQCQVRKSAKGHLHGANHSSLCPEAPPPECHATCRTKPLDALEWIFLLTFKRMIKTRWSNKDMVHPVCPQTLSHSGLTKRTSLWLLFTKHTTRGLDLFYSVLVSFSNATPTFRR